MSGAAVVIWLHALAALLFCGAAVAELRRPTRVAPTWVLLAALLSGALWTLGVAGIGAGEVAVRFALVLRNLGWLALLFALSSRVAGDARSRLAIYLVTGGCIAVAGVIAVVQAALPLSGDRIALESVYLLLRMLSTIAALLLLHQHVLAGVKRWSEAAAMLTVAAAVTWTSDLFVLAVAYVAGDWPGWLAMLHGIATVLAASAAMIAVHRRADRALSLSRRAATQAILLAAGGFYIVAVTAVTGVLGEIAGAQARMWQVAFVVGTGTALFTFLATPWLRAWSKVMVAKHLFSHRYDYRTEWMRFTETLGVSGPDVPPLPERVVRAVADLTASPAGLLLVAGQDGLVAGPAWRWEEVPVEAPTVTLAGYLARTGRIIDLDACRAGIAPVEEIAALPDWLVLRHDAWAVVPLLRADALIGALVLAQPPVARALDWEDFDLLGAAGRQAASYLAEEQAHAALADAQRFDEFNRRFAFIMHDLKNLVSQTALVARNAERHADNPAFRADMVATLQDTSQRMTTLIARLAQHNATPRTGVQPVSLLHAAQAIAAARKAQHPVEVSGTDALALADPQALDTLLGHLVQNAIEASAANAPVGLHVASGSDMADISVVDRGCGMSAAFVRDRLFHPFASDKPGGFGLGAFEARQMVRQMGGDLIVTTSPGEGSTFRVRLPRAAALEQAA